MSELNEGKNYTIPKYKSSIRPILDSVITIVFLVNVTNLYFHLFFGKCTLGQSNQNCLFQPSLFATFTFLYDVGYRFVAQKRTD